MSNTLRVRILTAALVLCLGGAAASAGTVLADDFDDGILNPAWITTFNGASGWAYSEAGTNLTAS
jgi:hypothetical protein